MTLPQPPSTTQPTIDWNDPKAKISKYFTVGEATYLPSWGVHHIPNDAEKVNIISMAAKMDLVRGAFNAAVTVHTWIRPTCVNCTDPAHKDGDYNKLVKGAPKSAHIDGLGVDFHVEKITCNDARTFLLPKLDEWKLRMEDNPGSSWVHLDQKPVAPGGVRFFKI